MELRDISREGMRERREPTTTPRIFPFFVLKMWLAKQASYEGGGSDDLVYNCSVTRLGNFYTLSNFLKHVAKIILFESPTFLGNFCKGVKIFHFSSEIIFGHLLQTFGNFLLVTLFISYYERRDNENSRKCSLALRRWEWKRLTQDCT